MKDDYRMERQLVKKMEPKSPRKMDSRMKKMMGRKHGA